MRAARIGTITFSAAVRLGTRLNAWNTMPTVLRRYSDQAAPVQRRDVDVAEFDTAGGRAEYPAEARQQRRLPTPAGAQQNHQRPGPHVEVTPVDGPHGVSAPAVLDDEVADVEITHRHGPPNATAGSTVTARRSPATLARRPITTAITGSSTNAHVGMSTRIGNSGRQNQKQWRREAPRAQRRRRPAGPARP